MVDSEDEYEIPLQDQRIFGAGIKRKRVKFIPSSTPATNPLPSNAQTSKSVGDIYLSLVLPKHKREQEPISNHKSASSTDDTTPHTCDICKLPLSSAEEDVVAAENVNSTTQTSRNRPHEASLAHQVCLSHSHPPSHLDRNRKGLAFLSSYGWDPDARVGLGAQGQGIQFPIKTKEKNDKFGIGVVIPNDKDLDKMRKVKEVKLDAGKARKLAEKDRKRTERLREAFYRSEDVERYLGGG